MKKKHLEIKLQSLQGFTNPKAYLEQYVTPAKIAAEILFLAHTLGDVEGRIVGDLGSGPGIFSVGACLMGAEKVHSVEVDDDALRDLIANVKRFNCTSIEMHRIDVSEFNFKVDTVFQNVPFGAQRKHADLAFIDKALEISTVTYALHNWETREFVMNRYTDKGGEITHVAEFEFTIPRIYNFHRKERVKRKFLFLRVENKRDNLK